MTKRQKTFAEAFARSPRKLTDIEWAERFGVSDRSIRNWKSDPEFEEYTRQLKDMPGMGVDGDVISKLSDVELNQIERLVQTEKKQREVGPTFATGKEACAFFRTAFKSALETGVSRDIVDLLAFLDWFIGNNIVFLSSFCEDHPDTRELKIERAAIILSINKETLKEALKKNRTVYDYRQTPEAMHRAFQKVFRDAYLKDELVKHLSEEKPEP